ncbi:hypothetical protein [Streptomyces inhibens]|uniref:hypothetical protein n=1 Tax=Streptomyces inhibens TaxID=2293571 RepID=UPI0015F24E20|nr:hypothetical protein [Streptomyces inhibens]
MKQSFRRGTSFTDRRYARTDLLIDILDGALPTTHRLACLDQVPYGSSQPIPGSSASWTRAAAARGDPLRLRGRRLHAHGAGRPHLPRSSRDLGADGDVLTADETGFLILRSGYGSAGVRR